MHFVYFQNRVFADFIDELPTEGVAFLDDPNRGVDYSVLVIVRDCERVGNKPLIRSKEQAYMLLGRASPNIFYFHPSIIDKYFLNFIVKKYPLDILSLPLTQIDHELAKTALINCLVQFESKSRRFFGLIFERMPRKFKDADMCMWAFQINKDLIKTFPQEHTNYDMYNCLGKNTHLTLWDIPYEYRTRDLCHKFLTYNKYRRGAMDLGAVPESFRTQALCYNLFKKCSDVIIYIPSQFITQEMVLTAAADSSSVQPDEYLRCIPEKYQTDQFWRIYVNKHWYYKTYLLSMVPNHLRTLAFIDECNKVSKKWCNPLLKDKALTQWDNNPSQPPLIMAM